MNNKKRGTEFEKTFCRLLREEGYWVHFLSPDNRGAQPFDIIAVRDGQAFAIDCKTSVKPYITVDRLQDNQIFAFELWLEKGNLNPLIAVLYDDTVYVVDYLVLKRNGRVNLNEEVRYA